MTTADDESTSRQGSEPTSTIILKAWPRRKSPTKTLASLPQSIRAASLPRRMSPLIDDIIVQQRGRMHELDAGGELDVTDALIGAEPRRRQRQHRSQTLAARRDKVLGRCPGSSRHVRPPRDRIVWSTRLISAATRWSRVAMPGSAVFSSSGITTPKTELRNVHSRRTPNVLKAARTGGATAAFARTPRGLPALRVPRAHARCPRLSGSRMIELLRTNDIVLISRIEALMAEHRIDGFRC